MTIQSLFSGSRVTDVKQVVLLVPRPNLFSVGKHQESINFLSSKCTVHDPWVHCTIQPFFDYFVRSQTPKLPSNMVQEIKSKSRQAIICTKTEHLKNSPKVVSLKFNQDQTS